MDEQEKKELRSRIITSANSYKTRRWKKQITSLSIAASLLAVLSMGLYHYSGTEASIVEYAQTSQEINNNDEVQLIIDGGNKIVIENSHTSIAYQAMGAFVSIADSLRGQQEVTIDSPNSYNTLIVPYGKRSQITLSDGTKVWLNSGSKLTYPPIFKGKNREVHLIGEAIFDVSHNPQKPFKVISSTQTIEVLGTVFNVSNYPEDKEIKTILKSGSVSISYKSNSIFPSANKIKITPGTLARFDKADPQVKTEDVDVENYFSWREGVLIFKNNNLQFITQKLSRYYNIDFIFEEEALESETFSGYLKLTDSVESVLNTLQQVTDLEYIASDDTTVTIYKIENRN